jgi:hypothetical protein
MVAGVAEATGLATIPGGLTGATRGAGSDAVALDPGAAVGGAYCARKV